MADSVKQIVTLYELLEHFKIDSHEWDALIVGDGSATTWDKEAGWGSILIQRDQDLVMPFYGGMSNGTNNMAEIMAMLHPLMYLSQHAEIKAGGYSVHVITDSNYTVSGLAVDNLINSPTLKKNRELWLAVFGTVRKGLRITSHHVLRDTLDVQKLTHDLANLARRKHINLMQELTCDLQNSIQR